MSNQDIRWIQRYRHYVQAFGQLDRAVELARQRPLSELEQQGLIQSFEYTHELAWNTMKDFLENKGVQPLYGSKDTTREAFKLGLIEDGEIWMQMIRSRNLTSHTYNQVIAEEITQAIRNHYHAAYRKLLDTLEPLTSERPE
jgi:nucleotidyltransferase substrate binding protein (TIGR01987 family)